MRVVSFGYEAELTGNPVRVRFARAEDGYWWNGSSFQLTYDPGTCRFLMTYDSNGNHYYSQIDPGPGVKCHYTAQADSGLLLDYGTINNEAEKQIVETAGNITVQQALSVILAIVAGETTSGGTTFRTPDGTAVRVVATVDASNNRTSISITPASP